ncbi:hypothetical protein BHM03_00040829 [Ensete ventricosum]|nr:hypothetical protein BHM03_00040829 [Ensete ventricosum]
MASRSSRRSSSTVPPISSPLLRSACPAAAAGAAPFSSPHRSSASSPFASSSSSSSRSSTFFHHRSASPTRVYLVGSTPPPRTPSVHFSLDRSTSPGRSLAVVERRHPPSATPVAPTRRTCMCSPTTHPGSFRCSLHKGLRFPPHHNQHAASSSPSNRLNARRSAMTNSLVRIGTVEGEWVKRALASLIRPSSHHQRRRADFRPRPTRFCCVRCVANSTAVACCVRRFLRRRALRCQPIRFPWRDSNDRKHTVDSCTPIQLLKESKKETKPKNY